MKFEIHAERTHYGRSIDVYVANRGERPDAMMVAKPPVFEEVIDYGMWHEPTLKLRADDAQRLMDELWRAGIRPTEGGGSAGVMAAAQAHLADMRTIAMGALKKEGLV
jgi:hypothetical protein